MGVNFLKPKDIQAKYGWGKNKAYELIQKIKDKRNLTYSELIIREDYYLEYFNE